ncbi:endonuclease/exonuclease/phosphatase family protein [Candidatus Woesebacteria bacterium]|nr:MAG: endonuclease/exonuclease/phosphatase family protein [Candidatus Woesebacteria bacterium]
MSLEIISWNILSGGFSDYGSTEKNPKRIVNLARAIKELKPDIVSLVDTYRWTEVFTPDDLKHIFEYPCVQSVKLNDQRLIKKGHDNGITVFSRVAGTEIQTVCLATRNAIKTHIVGIDVFSVYFDDVSEDTRIKQTQTVLKLVDPNIPTIITGDLNTFDEQDLTETVNNLNELAQKYPGPMKSMEASLTEMERGEVTKLLVNNGFVDLGLSKGNTVPAKLFPLPTDEPILRIDYAFGNSQVKLEEFKVLTEEKYGNLSDHYPIWMKVSI